MEICDKKKQGEYNMLHCVLMENHSGRCCFVIDKDSDKKITKPKRLKITNMQKLCLQCTYVPCSCRVCRSKLELHDCATEACTFKESNKFCKYFTIMKPALILSPNPCVKETIEDKMYLSACRCHEYLVREYRKIVADNWISDPELLIEI
jgi:hypothetical protein